MSSAVVGPAPAPEPAAAPRLAAAPRSAPAPAAAPRVRLDAIDGLRGLVMVLMVLDHVRDYLTAARFDPLDLAHTDTALFLTRWVTHFCAPTFVFLAGTSAWLSGARRAGPAALARFLVTRGLWLVLLEVTVVNLGWNFNLRFESGIILQVIWAIGASMVLLAGLVWLPAPVVGGIGVVLIAGHNAFDGVAPESLGAFEALWAVLHVSGPRELLGAPVWLLYPLVPWVGVMAAGYAFGPVFQRPAAQRRPILLGVGVALVAAFVALRAAGVYGDPEPWSPGPTLWHSALSFLDVAKYPPSLCYVLMTLGPALLVLGLWGERRGPVSGWLVTFGRVPLFFYVLHVYLVHGIGMLGGVLQGYPASAFLRDFLHLPEGHGYGLAGVYAGWIVALAVLTRPARWFAGVKQRSRSPWLSYL